MAYPEGNSQADYEGGSHDESPRGTAGTLLQKFFSRGADVLRARQLQIGKFFDFERGRSFGGCRFRTGFGCLFWPGLSVATRTSGGKWLRIPNFLGIDLGLSKGREIIADGLFGIETEVLGIGANEAFIEDAAREI